MDSLLKGKLEKLECHFTWDLGQHQNELQGIKRKMDHADLQKITFPVHFYNLLGFIQKSLGSGREALESLQKAKSVIQEQGTEETAVRLQVNKANLAWVHFHLGELEKSRGYLEELEDLQRIHPAPPGCPLHPEVSGEKGWALAKFNMSKKRQAIDNFKMALEAEPERKEWHKGLAAAMNRAFIYTELTPELKAEILEKVKKAAEMDPNDLFLQSLYVLKKSEVQGENVDEEIQSLLEKFISTANLVGLPLIIEYFKGISYGRAIEVVQRFQEIFPSSSTLLRILANLYKWKVFSMKEDSMERQIWVQKSIELYEEVVVHYPDCVKGRLDLASLYCYAHNTKKAEEIYQQLLSEDNTLPPHTKQLLYYSYACYLHHTRQFRDKSINFHMKAAEIQNNSYYKDKSIMILQKTVQNGNNSRCGEIERFLKNVLKEE
ncbi:interferon-induced protein with tetratricopeptide repeats 1-like [Danio aesculapii]|uniref:interferon-induced protein with tetratricopeptide repeats 1-like n=1 Tax=Danio aesculapii TaxID=1142201 RepID=UPI0024C00F33|nr:interferon-induced protein with tetratricopeptide repeats 1-like [Danio aesculapii]